MKARVLVVDDDPGLRYTLVEILEAEGLEVTSVDSGEAALLALRSGAYSLVITDLRMPGLDGMGLLAALRREPRPPRVVMITAHGSERTAVEAMKAGAWDYLRKPFEVEELLRVVERAVETLRLAAENERLSGERILSRTMVFASPRAERPYVRFNCASISPDLAEAELFGHSKGAFTGAARARPGLFGEADGGTLLLDEVGELDLSTQARLLRALQEGEIRAVGEERPRKVNVRILAATHRDLREQVSQGRFREDLFYRLNVVNLRVPALRERPEDVPVLVRHFLDRFSERFGTGPIRLEPAVLDRLLAWGWPGNVRELINTMESLVALSVDGVIDPALLPGEGEAARPALGLRERVDAYERGLIVEALRAAGGNQSEAARRLGLPRVTLHDKLRRYGLEG